jgi:hypothetical protein
MAHSDLSARWAVIQPLPVLLLLCLLPWSFIFWFVWALYMQSLGRSLADHKGSTHYRGYRFNRPHIVTEIHCWCCNPGNCHRELPRIRIFVPVTSDRSYCSLHKAVHSEQPNRYRCVFFLWSVQLWCSLISWLPWLSFSNCSHCSLLKT